MSGTREQKRQKKANELLEASKRLLDKGLAISELTVDNLRTEAGMARSTFYVYFEDKTDLIRVLMNQLFNETLEPVEHWWNIVERGCRQELNDTLHEAGKALYEHRSTYRLIEESAHSAPHLKETINQYHNTTIALAQQAVEKAKAQAIIRDDVTPEMVESLHWMVNAVLTGQSVTDDKESLERYSASLTEIMWRTLFN